MRFLELSPLRQILQHNDAFSEKSPQRGQLIDKTSLSKGLAFILSMNRMPSTSFRNSELMIEAAASGPNISRLRVTAGQYDA